MDLAQGNEPGTTPADSVVTQQDAGEKLLKQSEVNDLLGRAKHAAYEKGKREAMDASQNSQSQQTANSSMGHMPAITEDEIRRMIADEAHKQNQLQSAQQMIDNFGQQMGSGKGKYQDFDETIASLGNLQNIPHLVQMATETGMAGDVMYDLGKNPGKVATLTTLSYVNPHLAKIEMNKLAHSIKTNEAAAQARQAQEPLDQVTPSTVGTDNGSNSIRDLRKMGWARA